MEKTLRGMGFLPKIKTYRDIHAGDYCASLFVPLGVRENGIVRQIRRLVLKYGRALPKIGWALSSSYAPDDYAYMRGVVLGLRPALKGVPIYDEYIQAVLAITDGHKQSFTHDALVHFNALDLDIVPTAATYNFYCDRYGISKRELCSFADLHRKVYKLPCAISHPIMAVICDVDLA
jgi:hypothetical protein